MSNLRNTYHRDGTVTYWSVYDQQWVRRASRVPDRELAAMNDTERARTLRHLSNARPPTPKPAGYIIAGPTAIWAAADTEAAAYAAYARDTGDDTLSLDDMRSARPGSGRIYIMPATARLLAHVGEVGGDTSWDDGGDVADVIADAE